MKLENRYDLAALLLRLATGALFLAHGLYLKVFVFGVPGTVGFFQNIGYPAAAAYLVIALETVAGMALIAGVLTRWVSVATLPVLAGASLLHAGNGWVFSAPGGGWEYPVFWIVVMAALALLGDGRLSLAHRFIRHRGATAAQS